MFYDAIKGLWYNILIQMQEADMGLWFILFFICGNCNTKPIISYACVTDLDHLVSCITSAINLMLYSCAPTMRCLDGGVLISATLTSKKTSEPLSPLSSSEKHN